MLLRSQGLGSNVKYLANEKLKLLAEANGWSLEHAQGYVDGEIFRLRGKKPSSYVLVGIDEYSFGFRDAYYERRNSTSPASLAKRPASSPIV